MDGSDPMPIGARNPPTKRTTSDLLSDSEDELDEVFSSPPAQKKAHTSEEISPDPFVVSLFDPTKTTFSSLMTCFSKHLIPHLSPEDAATMATMNSRLHRGVVENARISAKQVSYALRNKELCARAPDMTKRLLDDPSTLTQDVIKVFVSSLFCTVDAQASYNVMILIVDQLNKNKASFINGALIENMWGASHRQDLMWSDWVNETTQTHTLRLGRYASLTGVSWIPTEPTRSILKACDLYEILGLQALMLLLDPGTKVDWCITRLCKDTINLLYALYPEDQTMCIRLAITIVNIMARLETAGESMEPELEALDVIMARLDGGRYQPDLVTAIAKSGLRAPVLRLYNLCVTRSPRHNPTPLTIALDRGDTEQLREIARLSMVQHISPQSQCRAVIRGLKRKAFSCVRVLSDGGFVSRKGSGYIMDNQGQWGNIDRRRAFQALLSPHNIAWTSAVPSMVNDFIGSMKLAKSVSFGATCNTWASIVAGDFVSAMWRATDCKGDVRDTIASTTEFNKFIDHVLVAHLLCIIMPALEKAGSASEVETLCDGESMRDLVSRVSELFDIQNRANKVLGAVDNDDDAFFAYKFEHWLRGILERIAGYGWCAIQMLCDGIPDIRSYVLNGIVHTDLFSTSIVLGRLRTCEPTTLRQIIQHSVNADPDHDQDGSSVLMARRIIRWASLLKPKLKEDHIREYVPHLTELALEIKPYGIKPETCDSIIDLMKSFILIDSGKTLGGVCSMFVDYNGDVNEIIKAICSARIKSATPPTIEPSGDLREVLEYAVMAPPHILEMIRTDDHRELLAKCYRFFHRTGISTTIITSNAHKGMDLSVFRDIARAKRPTVLTFT